MGEMELSQEVKAGLMALSKPQTFNAAQFAAVIKLTLDAVVSMQEVGKSFEGAFISSCFWAKTVS